MDNEALEKAKIVEELGEQSSIAFGLLDDLRDVLLKARAAKPEKRSELSRRYAVAITMLEQALAYVYSYIVQDVETWEGN